MIKITPANFFATVILTPARFLPLILLGCATSIYHPFSDGVGYTEVEVGKDKYEVMFHGTADQDELVAKKYALIRAAEIGKRNGFGFFAIDNGKTKEKEDKDVIRETESRSLPDERYLYPHPEKHRKTETVTVTHTETRPTIKILVIYHKDECPDCLSVDQNLAEATESGILKK